MKELLKSEFLINHNRTILEETFEFRRKVKPTREWCRITTYKDKKYIYIEYMELPLISDIVAVKKQIENKEEIPLEIPFWLKSYMEIALENTWAKED